MAGAVHGELELGGERGVAEQGEAKLGISSRSFIVIKAVRVALQRCNQTGAQHA